MSRRVSPAELDMDTNFDPPTSTVEIGSSTITEFNKVTGGKRDQARRRWDIVKRSTNGPSCSLSRGFKVGESVSMSTAEAKFLSTMMKNMLEMDLAKLKDEQDQVDAASATSPMQSLGVDNASSMPEDGSRKVGGTNMFHVVKAAVAKERMRNSIAQRLENLSGPEVNFLTAMVNSEDVTSEQLENAIDVLDNNPLYNLSLREKEEEDVVSIDGEHDKNMRRKESLTRQSSMFDVSLSTRKSQLDCSGNSRRSSAGRRQQLNRKASQIELSFWKEVDATRLDESTRSRHSTARSIVAEPTSIRNGNSLDEHDFSKSALQSVDESDAEKPYKFEESTSITSTKHIKKLSYRAGEAIDPLLSIIPMETQDDPISPTIPRQTPFKEKKSKNYDSAEIGKLLLRPFLCCGMDEVEVMAEEKVSDDVMEEFGSLESKKRFLQLQDTGAPEDYPILGLEAIGEDGNDPLDPHVLSPLLMKCLREHLPYSHQEENFWLKYSLVRDGASLEVIFKQLRHSQHTILAIETTQGEVFGSFTSHAWRSNGNNYYGSCDAFVWNLRRKRDEDNCNSLDEYVLRESTLDVYPWASNGGNRNVQLSNSKKLFVGGGEPDEDVFENVEMYQQEGDRRNKNDESNAVQWGMALALDADLLYGTSSRCATFGSDPLVDRSQDTESEVFEILNLEIWVSITII